MTQRQAPLKKICLLVLVTGVCLTPSALALSALDVWDGDARSSLPLQIKVWLGTMMLTNLAALGFVRNHSAARYVFGGFVLSHGVVLILAAQGLQVLAGQVSFFHIIFWTPGMIALILTRAEIKFPSMYGVWACLSLLFYFGSMTVDLRDAFIYIDSLF